MSSKLKFSLKNRFFYDMFLVKKLVHDELNFSNPRIVR
jgi:hypothetical protein